MHLVLKSSLRSITRRSNLRRIIAWTLSIVIHIALIIVIIINLHSTSATIVATATEKPIISAYVIDQTRTNIVNHAPTGTQKNGKTSATHHGQPNNIKHLPTLSQAALKKLLMQLTKLISQQLPQVNINGAITLQFRLSPQGKIDHISVISQTTSTSVASHALHALRSIPAESLAQLTKILPHAITVEAPFVFR